MRMFGCESFCGELDLAEKSLVSHCNCDFWVHDLEGDLAIVTQVFRKENCRHSAARDLPLDPVAVAEQRLEFSQLDFGNGHAPSREGWNEAAAAMNIRATLQECHAGKESFGGSTC